MPVEARAMKDLRGYFSAAQVEAMIAGCDNLRDRLLIRLLWRTGMRISELVRPGNDRSPVLGLRVTDILWQDNALIIRHAKRKGNPPRRIDIDQGTLGMIREYLGKRGGNSEFVINLGRQMAYLVVRQAAERIGITEVGDPLVSQRRHPHPHHLRHSLAVHSVRVTKGNYGDLIRLQSQLGHASLSTTASYVQFSDEEQRKWYDDLWNKEKEEK
ncbi:site-specific integrase [Patescibacteria group bacterium]|nr:site-specific integrase [Patescibacteria group bacterium]